MNIQFFSHACFSIENEEVILLNDPYLNGTAFNNGWDLIVDDVVFDRFSEKKLFIYYSHEHPDHFSIPFLKSINNEIRSYITIVFQKTRDGRVKSFLESQGFMVLELENRERVQISNGFFITIGQVPFYDSWALIEVDGKKILNANDCILETPDRVQDIKETTDSVDILFTQFSYANWVEGGSLDGTSRALLANEKLQRIKIQSDVLRPDFIVPFASMVRFCHTENSYMNDEINTPDKTVEFINRYTDSDPFLMVPYENWDGVSSKCNLSAIQFWNVAYKKALNRPLLEPKNFYDFPKLKSVCEEMCLRVRMRNNKVLIFLLCIFELLPSQNIKITDLNCYVNFSWRRGLKITNREKKQQYCEMSSESLYFLFKFDFGIDTLNVNARFAGSLAQKKSLIRTFSPLALNNTGRFITFSELLSILSEPAFIKQGLRTVGLKR
ncbi:MBL fold metallo-hydrolase [Polynucleobacter sp. MWH-UH24A]|uniref:MBL fold metallo-hydrolase n=1 Tax=Polynucleobacter sp. MWH-UH24A TaxID=2689110 RepID=UPI001BFE78E1|nr:MBL fold metallo-hydrolase [Polynucleobacter sp. MWH-UH24A]QWD76441.1 MBL fold metallo-hydrolase [Polynucleobacter sp. MWH-UH24A]